MGFGIFRKKRITELAAGAGAYADGKINALLHTDPDVLVDLLEQDTDNPIRYSKAPQHEDDTDNFTGEDSSYTTAGQETAAGPDTRYSIKIPKDLIGEVEKNVAVSEKTFVTEMIGYMNSKGLKNADVYKAANMDRRLFSKIASKPEYKPSKDTCIAIVIALKLTLPETEAMLKHAGYALSDWNRRDMIIEYMIREQAYDLNDINLVLYELKETPIGEKCRS